MKSILTVLTTLILFITFTVPVHSQRGKGVQGIRRMPRDLTQAKMKTHVMKPAHTQDVEAEKDPELERAFELKKKPRVVFKQQIPRLNVNEFGEDLDAILKSSTTGYALAIRKNGVPIYGLVRGWAHTPSDGALGWTGDLRMHVASVSKLMTAIGLVKLLDSKGISLDKQIISYLPKYWTKGANVNKITFRHLLKHRSGLGVLPLVGGGQSSASDFAFMKQNIALGVPEPGTKSVYQNVNYGLMRVLMSVINGDVDADFTAPAPFGDIFWDSLTIGHYKDYMQDRVFSPAGVANAGFAPLPAAINSALAYDFPAGQSWNSGDLSTVSGGAGWRLSIHEVLNVMDHFRRRNTIVNSTRALQILDAGIGLNGVITTPAGKIYYKKGSWGSGGRQENCVAYFLPENMEMVIYVNSPVTTQNFSIHKLVRDIYLNSLE